MPEQSFQEALAGVGFQHCWGCGVANEHGLHVTSRWAEDGGDEAICDWQPQPYHVASPGILSGGIIATLIDCHCAATACAAAYRAEGRPITGDDLRLYVTAALNVTYLRPTPSAAPVRLRAHVTNATERKTTLACSLYSGDTECARGEVICARVQPAWQAAPDATAQEPQRPSFHEMAGMAATDEEPLNDEEVSQWLDEHRTEKYDR